MPVSIDIEGSVQDPDWNSWLYGAFAPVVVGGIRVPMGGDVYSLSLEGRYQYGVGKTGGEDAGFVADKIDLSGGSFNVGFLVRF